MRVHILNKNGFDHIMKQNGIDDSNVEQFNSILFISITDTDNFIDRKEPYFKENHDNVINLSFDDVEHDGEPSPTNFGKGTRAFSEKQAKQLYEFIKKNREVETCLVHCMAGISRSGAVGTFINGYCRGDWERFKRDNPQIAPNARVSRMLNAARYNDLDD